MRTDITTKRKRKQSRELVETVKDAELLADKLGLDPAPVKFWVVDFEEMSQAVAYQGFPNRYPHWRWGMMYQQIKQTISQGGKFYEIVVHSDPAHAYLQESNTPAVQKLVITHVLAHADVFKNNRYYKDLIGTDDAARILESNAERIEEIMSDTEIDREEVEQWIDHLLCIEDNIDQYEYDKTVLESDEDDPKLTREEITKRLTKAGFSQEIIDAGIDIDSILSDDDTPLAISEDEADLLWVFYTNGMTYDAENERAVEMEQWQLEIIQMLRDEFYIFAPIKLTKTLNEGWAVFWHSMMMMNETFAKEDEYIDYAQTTAKVLQPGGGSFNPYNIGYDLWKYAENKYNREHLLHRLFSVEGINPDTFPDLDFTEIKSLLTPSEYLTQPGEFSVEQLRENLPEEYLDSDALKTAEEGDLEYSTESWRILTYPALAARNYSLLRPENGNFLETTPRHILEQEYRYIDTPDKYSSIEEAVSDLDYTYAWEKMKSDRETSNDTTFFEKHLSPEFVDKNNYFAYGFNFQRGRFEVTSTEFKEVKNQIQQEVTNFGKPQIKAIDFNYKNKGKLLLEHKYSGVPLNQQKAADTLSRVFNLWGRPVHLRTIVAEHERDGGVDERGVELIYDPDEGGITQKKLRRSEYKHLLD